MSPKFSNSCQSSSLSNPNFCPNYFSNFIMLISLHQPVTEDKIPKIFVLSFVVVTIEKIYILLPLLFLNWNINNKNKEMWYLVESPPNETKETEVLKQYFKLILLRSFFSIQSQKKVWLHEVSSRNSFDI